MEHNWRLLELLGAHYGRDLGGRGPFDPESDPAWQRHVAGESTNDEYWDEISRGIGFDDRIALWREMSSVLDGAVFAADALELIQEARAAGIPVGILSNDLVRSSGRSWVDSRPELSCFDVLVDATEFGARKPAPGPYLEAARQLGLTPEDIVFLDDMQYCIDGAHAVGMVGLLVDPLCRSIAFDRARSLVGLGAPSAESDGDGLPTATLGQITSVGDAMCPNVVMSTGASAPSGPIR
jgi:putative hydrolase of the HAD superfamily